MTCVLVVEDDAVVLQLCKTVLELEGHFVLTAANATEALLRVEAAPDISAAVVDLILPGQSGSELVAELRAAGMHGPVICMSGYPVENNSRIADPGLLSAYFLPKPFTPVQLARAVATALGEGAH